MDGKEPQRQSLRDAATLLPIVAAILLGPPLIRIFAAPAEPAGIPLIILYIFGVWAAIVVGAYLLARRLGASEEPAPGSGDDESRG